MSIIFSKGCEYGIQATLFIVSREGRRVGIREAATELRIPAHFLAKILHVLSRKGVLSSYKGTNGGFTLADDPSRIHLVDIVRSIDGLEMFTACVLGFPNCDSEHPCPVHHVWGEVRTTIYTMLSEQTLADLMPVTKEKIASVMRSLHAP
jgi:Rrf2 family iron-sulfur cluster assembly transcriptional regulator